MSVATVSRRRRGRQCAAAVALATLFLLFEPSLALASGGLSSIVMKTSLPGFALSPVGADNGPINDSNLAAVFPGDTSAQRNELSQALSSGELSGFVRLWRSEPLTGDGVVLLGFQSPSVYTLSTFLGGFEREASLQVSQNQGSNFAIPGVADAVGYNIDVANSAPAYQEYIVAFAKGNSAFFLTLVSTKYDLHESDAITLAQRQWAKAPGAAVSPQTPPSVAEDLLFGAIAALVVAALGILWQRERTRRLVRDNPLIDVTRYATYNHLPKDQRKVARKSLVKLRVNPEGPLNQAALAWADHQMRVYWITVAAFVAGDVTILIVSQGHVVVVSILALAMVAGALKLRRKKNQFLALQNQYVELVASQASAPAEAAPTPD